MGSLGSDPGFKGSDPGVLVAAKKPGSDPYTPGSDPSNLRSGPRTLRSAPRNLSLLKTLMSKQIAASRIRLKRVYETPGDDDGARVLVDRLWPRGVSKEAAKLYEWLREIAPADELRRWFGHDVARWDEFRDRYRTQLREQGEEHVSHLQDIARKQTLTLVYAAHDEAHNNAVILREVLLGR